MLGDNNSYMTLHGAGAGLAPCLQESAAQRSRLSSFNTNYGGPGLIDPTLRRYLGQGTIVQTSAAVNQRRLLQQRGSRSMINLEPRDG